MTGPELAQATAGTGCGALVSMASFPSIVRHRPWFDHLCLALPRRRAALPVRRPAIQSSADHRQPGDPRHASRARSYRVSPTIPLRGAHREVITPAGASPAAASAASIGALLWDRTGSEILCCAPTPANRIFDGRPAPGRSLRSRRADRRFNTDPERVTQRISECTRRCGVFAGTRLEPLAPWVIRLSGCICRGGQHRAPARRRRSPAARLMLSITLTE